MVVREDLTMARLKLLQEVMKKFSVKRVWTADGMIKVNVDKRRPVSVKTNEQFQALLLKCPPDALSQTD